MASTEQELIQSDVAVTTLYKELTADKPGAFWVKVLSLALEKGQTYKQLAIKFDAILSEHHYDHNAIIQFCDSFLGFHLRVLEKGEKADHISSIRTKAIPGRYVISKSKKLAELQMLEPLLVGFYREDGSCDITHGEARASSTTEWSEPDKCWHVKWSIQSGTSCDVVFSVEVDDKKRMRVAFRGLVVLDASEAHEADRVPVEGIMYPADEIATLGPGNVVLQGNLGVLMLLYCIFASLFFILVHLMLFYHLVMCCRNERDGDDDNYFNDDDSDDEDPRLGDDGAGDRGAGDGGGGRQFPRRNPFRAAGAGNRSNDGRQGTQLQGALDDQMLLGIYRAARDGLRDARRQCDVFVEHALQEHVVATLQDSLDGTEASPGTIQLPLKSWYQIFRDGLKSFKAGGDGNTDIQALEEQFLSHVVASVIRALQPDMSKKYIEIKRGSGLSTVLDLFDTDNHAGRLISNSIEQAVFSDTVVPKIGVRAREYAFFEHARSVASTPFEPTVAPSDVVRQAQDMEAIYAKAQHEYTAYVEKLAEKLGTATVTLNATAKAIVDGKEIEQSRQGQSFSRPAAPSEYPGVPFWMLMLGAAGLGKGRGKASGSTSVKKVGTASGAGGNGAAGASGAGQIELQALPRSDASAGSKLSGLASAPAA